MALSGSRVANSRICLKNKAYLTNQTVTIR
jgi:hypothetical protein